MYNFLLPYVKNYLIGIDGNWTRLPDAFLLDMVRLAVSALESRTRLSFRWRNIACIHSSDKTFGSFSIDSDYRIIDGNLSLIPPGGRLKDAAGREFFYNGISPEGVLRNIYPDPLPFVPENPLTVIPDAVEMGYDYEWDDLMMPTVDLNTKPVRVIHEAAIKLVTMQMLNIPLSWVQVHDNGFSVVPFSAPGYIFGAAMVPFQGGHIPGGWNIKYSAGILPEEFDGRWGDLRMLAVKASVVEVLKAIREGRHPGLVGVGIAHMGISENFSRFAQTIASLETDIERTIATMSGSFIFVA